MENQDGSSPTKIDGRSMLGFSLTSPDLVLMASPHLSNSKYEESPEIFKGGTIDVSLKNGIEGSEIMDSFKSPMEKIDDLCTEASLEFLAIESPGEIEHFSELDRLKSEHELQKKELYETKRLLEEFKRENEVKSRECKEAWRSLKELQDELMRKSMHVGSLAFAIEGQVTEKSRWFSSLGDMTRKLKLLKMDQISLLQDASVIKNYVTEMEDFKSIVQSTITQHVQLHDDIKAKFLRAFKEKKELYNKVLELKGNIRVFCRCRPLNNEEIAEGASMAVDFEAAKDGELCVKQNGISKKTFKFDAIFSPEAYQAEVFEETAPLATSVLDGYNVCIFAYGQTGTGKTFTMEGTNEARGVNYRTLKKLFQIIEDRKNTFNYEVSVSVLEVYNEQIRDLLASGSQTSRRLEIKQVGEGGHHVPGLVEAHVKNVSEVWEVLRTGSNGRATGSTSSNEHSSRSHCMHCVMVKGENVLSGECTRTKLWLVDLAGSERIAKAEVQGERLKETQNINRSLFALGDVISALANKSPHIPFRNSKLTHLLQDSLGGDSKTLMFVQISPNENDMTETLCSLNFASRVRGIELGPARKQADKTELFKHKQLAEKLKQDLKSKDLQVKKLEDINYGLEVKIKERDVKTRNLQEKIKELESQLLVERKLARQHVDSKLAEQHQLQEHNSEPVPPPLSTRPLLNSSLRPQFEIKSQENTSRNSTESEEFSFRPPSLETFATNSHFLDKENNPDIAKQLRLPKQTGRTSLCPNIQKLSRRDSLIPMPKLSQPYHHQPVVTPPMLATGKYSQGIDDNIVEGACNLPEQIATCDSPKEHQRTRSEKISTTSVLRRSLQKKKIIHMKTPSPLVQQKKRVVGVNVGMDKLRVSIGGRGKNGQRFLASIRSRNTRDGMPQKLSHREKERGWNIGTLNTRNVV